MTSWFQILLKFVSQGVGYCPILEGSLKSENYSVEHPTRVPRDYSHVNPSNERLSKLMGGRERMTNRVSGVALLLVPPLKYKVMHSFVREARGQVVEIITPYLPP